MKLPPLAGPKGRAEGVPFDDPEILIANHPVSSTAPFCLPVCGSTLVDPDGDAECRHAIGPSGPFLPDKGRALLQEGIDHPPPSTL